MSYRIIGINDELNISGSVICLGNFDGVHIGHQKLIKTAIEIANQNQLTSIFFTIFPSPKSVLGKREEKYLTSLEDRYRLARSMGVDEMVVLPFNQQVAHYHYSEFIEQILMKYRPKYLVCGADFHFGYLGEGNITHLQEIGEGKYKVEVVSDVIYGDEKVSTTKIIEILNQRDLQKAKQFLGRRYAVEGTVIKGHGNGKKFGFPTANLDTNNYFLPNNGVYAVNVIWKDKKYKGMANIGVHPTVSKLDNAVLEVHIFDFEHDIYSEKINIEFCHFIRLERHFLNSQQLIEQLQRDIAYIKTLQF